MTFIQTRVFTRFIATALFAFAAFLFISTAQAAELNGENFNTHSGSDYKGINVGFNISDFETVESVSVSLYQDDTFLVENTHNTELLNLINGLGTAFQQHSTPFIIQAGSYVEEYWNLGDFDWTIFTKPNKAMIEVNGELAEILDLSEAIATYESLLTSATPGFGGVWYVDEDNGGDEDGSEQHPFNTLEEAIATAQTGDTVALQSDIHTMAVVSVNKSLTIEGNSHTLFPEYVFTDNSNNSGLLITEDDTVVRNLTIDGVGGTNLHGIHVYVADGVELENTTVQNNDKSGLNVNGSTVTVINITTAGNGWGGINVDQGSGVTADAILTVEGESFHSESGPYIWVDHMSNPQVSVIDTENQYVSTNLGDVQSFVLAVVKVRNDGELRTAVGNLLVENIELADDITLDSVLAIDRAITIDGADHTLSAAGTVVNNLVLITGDDVTVKNLVIDGDGHAIHGLQAYKATNVNLENVTVQNNGKSGITVNGSTMTVTNITTSDNAWGGINVDQGVGVTEVTTLTVNGTSAHTETPAIWRDDNAKVDVTVVDINSQYDASTYIHDGSIEGTIYVLKQAPAPSTSGGGGGGGKKSMHDQDEDEDEGEVLGAATSTVATTTSTTGSTTPVVYYSFLVDFGIGTENADVTNLQTILIAGGYLDIPTPTGYFGPLTLAAVQKLQAANGIPSTGFVGPLTRAYLNTLPINAQNDVQKQIADLLAQVAALQALLDAMTDAE